MSENRLNQPLIGLVTSQKLSANAIMPNGEPDPSPFDALPLVALTRKSMVDLTERFQIQPQVSAATGLSECCKVPIAQDDFAITAINASVTIDVLSNDPAFNGEAREVILLNTPVGATTIVNNDGTITFTPKLGFLGTSTIHYSVEDSNDNSSEATITVEVLTQFAFDTYADLSLKEKVARDDVCQPTCCRHESLSIKIFTLVAAPRFEGSACPGAVVAGRIYDQSGALVGEASVNSDDEGHWILKIDNVRDQEFYRIEFYHVPDGCSNSDVSFTLDSADGSYQVMTPLALHELC